MLKDFTAAQLDCMLFIHGLALVFLSAACGRLREVDRSKGPWLWLGLFALLRGFSSWLGVLSLSFGAVVLVHVRAATDLVALICLLEFGRRGNSRGTYWFHYVWAVPCLLWTLACRNQGLQAACAGTFGVFGVTGGLWAAWTLRRSCRANGGCLTIASIAMVVYAIAFLVPYRADMARLWMEPSGIQIATLAATAVQGLLATLICIAVWQQGEIMRRQPGDRRWLYSGTGLVLILVLVVVGGWTVAAMVGTQAEREMAQNLSARVKLASAALDDACVAKLTGEPQEVASGSYKSLKRQLAELCRATQDCRFLYLLTRRGSNLVFMADSEPEDSPDCSPAGQVYAEATPAMASLFDAPRSIVEGPYVDRWGVWVSGFEPLYGPGNRSLLAVVGMDVAASHWRRETFQWRLPVLCLTLLIDMLLVTFAVMQQKSRESAARVAASELAYRSLVEGSPNWVALFDREGRFLVVNANGLAKMGLSEPDVLGKPIDAVWPEAASRTINEALVEVRQGKQRTCQVKYSLAGGPALHFHLSLMPISEGDSVTRIVAIGMDITERVRTENEQTSRLQRLERQHGVAVRLATDKSLGKSSFDEAATAITVSTAKALEVGRVGVWLLSEDRQLLRCVDLYDAKTGRHERGMAFAAQEHPAYFAALESGRGIPAEDAIHDERTREFAESYLLPSGVASLIDSGIRVDGEIVGVLCCEHVGDPRHWHHDEISFAGFIADQAASLIIRAKRKEAQIALQESESRLKTILESIQAGLVVIDAETHTIVDANPVALGMLGAARDEIVGHVCHDYICPAEGGRCPVTDCGQQVDNSERVLKGPDSKTIPVLKTVVPIVLHGRKHLLESFVDITERKRIEADLAAHRERLEELVAARTDQLVEAERQVLQAEKLASIGRLAAGVAHEINTPIQYVGDNLRALSETFTDLTELVGQYQELATMIQNAQVDPSAVDRLREAEERIDLPFLLEDTPKAISQGLDGVQRVAGIVRAMKDFSHMKAGQASSVDINHSLQSTLAVARNEYKYVADVETQFGELSPVQCFISELNQVFLNILVNAAHAIQDTGRRGKITISTRQDGDFVQIVFADTGCGIPEDARKKIYDPFFTTKEVGRGTGQGLYLAHQIVVATHGGTIDCDSTVGVGTEFRIRIPIELKVADKGSAGTAPPATVG